MYPGRARYRNGLAFLWSRKSPFRCPLCHQAIPFEIRRRRELCYLRVWADQRQIPGWDAYVRNWYAWWGFPSRIVNYHNLVAGREASHWPCRFHTARLYTLGDINSISRYERNRGLCTHPSWPVLLDFKVYSPFTDEIDKLRRYIRNVIPSKKILYTLSIRRFLIRFGKSHEQLSTENAYLLTENELSRA